ncbi:hypothetical protein H6G65_14465 [Microcystis elabens FACHB-917]|nr:hypothetical protein [Microcystis elabens FACHB-917]
MTSRFHQHHQRLQQHIDGRRDLAGPGQQQHGAHGDPQQKHQRRQQAAEPLRQPDRQDIEASRSLHPAALQAGQQPPAQVPQPHHQGHQQGQGQRPAQRPAQRHRLAAIDLVRLEHPPGAAQAPFQQDAPLFGQLGGGAAVELGVLIGDREQGEGAGPTGHEGRQPTAAIRLFQQHHPQVLGGPQQAQVVGVAGGLRPFLAEVIEQRLPDAFPRYAGIAGLVQLAQVPLDHPGPLGGIRPGVASRAHRGRGHGDHRHPQGGRRRRRGRRLPVAWMMAAAFRPDPVGDGSCWCLPGNSGRHRAGNPSLAG